MCLCYNTFYIKSVERSHASRAQVTFITHIKFWLGELMKFNTVCLGVYHFSHTLDVVKCQRCKSAGPGPEANLVVGYPLLVEY